MSGHGRPDLWLGGFVFGCAWLEDETGSLLWLFAAASACLGAAIGIAFCGRAIREVIR